MGAETARARQKRAILRRSRYLTSLSFVDTLKWFLKTTWIIILYQSIYGGLNVYFNVWRGKNIHDDILGLSPGYRPYLLGTLQFISAFLVGLAVNDAASRYKQAMSALMSL